MNNELETRLHWIDEKIDTLTSRLSCAPDGSLRVCIERGASRFYQGIPNGGGRRYLGPDCEDEIKRLAQKEYDQKALALLQREQKNLARLLADGGNTSIDELYLGMPEAKREFVEPVRLPDDEYAARWQAQPCRQKAIDEAAALSTERGDLVRSKSEVIIANTLYAAGIPYRYECPVTLAGMGEVHPDFTVLNARTREVYLWEHLGMMDDPQYLARAMRRLAAYEANGYMEGKNLIITMECSSCTFDTRAIRARIDAFLR